jgi:cytochrome c553
MKRNQLAIVLMGALLAASAVAALAAPQTAPAMTAAQRGEHFVKTMGCTDCHTPMKMGPNGPESDASRFLSGHPSMLVMPPAPKMPEGPWGGTFSATFTAWAGPWGTSFTANLTPDKETGLGAWTAQTFLDAIRTGKHMGRGRPIMPPMPYPALQNQSDEELRSIFAYLTTIPAIPNRVPDPIPPEMAEGK